MLDARKMIVIGLGQGFQNLGRLVGGGDEIYIVAALFLEIEHDGRQVPGGDFLAFPAVTDLIVLAKDAVDIAVGKKDGTRALLPHQGVFFPEMGSVRRDYRLIPGAAQAPLAVVPVHQAIMGTEMALAQDVIRGLNLFLEETAPMRLDIRW